MPQLTPLRNAAIDKLYHDTLLKTLKKHWILGCNIIYRY